MNNIVAKTLKFGTCLCVVSFLADSLAIAAPANPVPGKLECSWVANDFSGKDQWVQHDIEGICVMPDGTVFTNVTWEEGGVNVQQYQNGKLIRAALHTHGWGNGSVSLEDDMKAKIITFLWNPAEPVN